MAKSKTLFISVLSITLITLLFSSLAESKPTRFSKNMSPKSVGLKKEKLTHLHFYFHDIPRGPKPTTVRIAQAQTTNTSPSKFGLLDMADDPLMVGPEPDSKLLGKAQGMFGFADEDELALMMMFNLVFTKGKYNGSSLSLLGRNHVFSAVREMPFVGGSGVFRLARGVAQGLKVVGKAQGMWGSAAQDENALAMIINFAFTEGKYNGSTLSLLGRNAVLSKVREMAIVGGSGAFRFARGYAKAKTHSFDSKTRNVVVEYNVYVFHY